MFGEGVNANEQNERTYKSIEEFVDANWIPGKTDLISAERTMHFEGADILLYALDSYFDRDLEISGAHEHIWAIYPDRKVDNIGYTKTGAFLEKAKNISEYTFFYSGSHYKVIYGKFDLWSHYFNVVAPKGFGNNNYQFMGRNCQNFTSEFFSTCH